MTAFAALFPLPHFLKQPLNVALCWQTVFLQFERECFFFFFFLNSNLFLLSSVKGRATLQSYRDACGRSPREAHPMQPDNNRTVHSLFILRLLYMQGLAAPTYLEKRKQGTVVKEAHGEGHLLRPQTETPPSPPCLTAGSPVTTPCRARHHVPALILK